MDYRDVRILGTQSTLKIQDEEILKREKEKRLGTIALVSLMLIVLGIFLMYMGYLITDFK